MTFTKLTAGVFMGATAGTAYYVEGSRGEWVLSTGPLKGDITNLTNHGTFTTKAAAFAAAATI